MESDIPNPINPTLSKARQKIVLVRDLGSICTTYLSPHSVARFGRLQSYKKAEQETEEMWRQAKRAHKEIVNLRIRAEK